MAPIQVSIFSFLAALISIPTFAMSKPAPEVLLSNHELATAQHVLNFEPYDTQKPFVIARHLGPQIWKTQVSSDQQQEMTKRTLWKFPPVNGFSEDLNSPRPLPSYIQHQGDEIGFHISLTDLKDQGLYNEVRGGGPHMAVGKELSAFPWAHAQNQLELETQVAVSFVQPSSNWESFEKGLRPVEQVSFALYFRDISTNQALCMIYNFFDPRGVYTPSVLNDTYIDFVSAPLSPVGSDFMTLVKDSAHFQTKPMAERARFHIAITEQNLLQAIRALNAKKQASYEELKKTNDLLPAPKLLGLNPDKYMVTLVNVFFELPNFVPNITTDAGVSIKGFQVQISKTN